MKLYVDNIEVANGNNDIGNIKNGKTISIGGRQANSSNSYKGNIDEVKIFDKALTSSQISDIYTNENAGRNYNDDTNTRDTITCTFCDKVTDVSKTECEALMALYNSTNGANWKNDENWTTSTKVEDWYGVWVWDGHVKTILLDDNNLTGGNSCKTWRFNGAKNFKSYFC
jgi:hypothetical protein